MMAPKPASCPDSTRNTRLCVPLPPLPPSATPPPAPTTPSLLRRELSGISGGGGDKFFSGASTNRKVAKTEEEGRKPEGRRISKGVTEKVLPGKYRITRRSDGAKVGEEVREEKAAEAK